MTVNEQRYIRRLKILFGKDFMTADGEIEPSFLSHFKDKTGVAANETGVAANVKPYSSYTTLVTQSGTNNPTEKELENDFAGIVFTWERTGVGKYRVTTSSAIFTTDKTVVLGGTTPTGLTGFRDVSVSWGTPTEVLLWSNDYSGNPIDGTFIDYPIAIRVYK